MTASLLLYTSFSGAQSTTKPPFIVACPLPPHAPILKPLQQAFNQALQPQDSKVVFISMPERRALAKLYRNELDGICGVSEHIQTELDSKLGILLDHPIARLNVIAVYDPDRINVDKINLFKQQQLQIGYAETSGSSKRYLEAQGYHHATAINNLQQAGRMLNSQRVSVLLGLDVVLFNLAFKGDFGRFQYQTFATQQAYPVIHPKHAKLEQQLNQQLAQLLRQRNGPISLDNLSNWMTP
ncbi:MAG: hypothetical protein CL693_06720 [Cellvibrionaceae bacterium]|nr:hypothetical protein [Cellvibrionaceae bacterium]